MTDWSKSPAGGRKPPVRNEADLLKRSLTAPQAAARETREPPVVKQPDREPDDQK
jgi:hypothetical protein